MVTSVLLVGSRDRQLEELLRSIAGQVTVTSDSDLMRLTAGAKMPQVIVLDARGEIKRRISELNLEHRDLDRAIEALELNPLHDELQLKRLKKRKLMLKDQIFMLQRQLVPDIPA